ncbi:MAG: four helix bundle protein [Bacteroidota bacterium]
MGEHSYPRENVILDKSFEFALGILEFGERLKQEKKFEIGQQIIRSGTSIGANVREAQNAESKRDFIHKLKIAAKEAEETEYWLLRCKHARNYPFKEELLRQIRELIKIMGKIIVTSKKSLT